MGDTYKTLDDILVEEGALPMGLTLLSAASSAAKERKLKEAQFVEEHGQDVFDLIRVVEDNVIRHFAKTPWAKQLWYKTLKEKLEKVKKRIEPENIENEGGK
jgi:hypothetical protein